MKKRQYLIAAASALAFALTACGGQGAKETTAVETTAETVEETKEETAAEGTEAQSSEDGSQAEEESTEETEEAKAELTQEDVTAFAEEIEGLVMNKDLKGLAEMVTYPVFVASVTDNEGIVEDKETFLALDKKTFFTEAFVDAVTAVDATTLEKSEAGYVIGDGTPNVIFDVSEDGILGITGINNQ